MTALANSLGETSALSKWMCASTKPGSTSLPAHIDLHFALVVLAHACDQPFGHGDVATAQLIAEDVHIRRVLEHEVGLLPSRGHLDDVELLVQLAVDLSCVAFPVCHAFSSLFCCV